MLNQRIREVRQARGMSQVELAGMLVKLALTLGVSTDYLLGLDGRKTLDVSGLPLSVVGHLQLLIEDIKAK